MMALYFFSVGLGTSMSGVLARYYDSAHEFAYFGIIGGVAVLAGTSKSKWPSRDLAAIELRMNQGEHGNRIARTRV